MLKLHLIRMAERKDIPNIINYIKREWNSQHIFVRRPAFFEYEYCNEKNVNGILAENLETGEIDGILLLYPLGETTINVDFFGGIWSVSHNCRTPMLGLKMVENVLKITGAKSHSGVGINANTTARIFRSLKHQRIGKLKHYYRLNNKDEYKIAYIECKRITEISSGRAFFMKLSNIAELDAVFELSKYKNLPYYKDSNYIKRRYFEHPIYDYNVIGIVIEDKVEGIVVLRKIECNGSKIARIIDFFGEDAVLKECGIAFQKMIEKEELEYIDFYEYGLDDSVLNEAGLIERKDDDNNIIPNYFEPYILKNVDLWFHTPYEKCRIFKGDGDQDRPNFVCKEDYI